MTSKNERNSGFPRDAFRFFQLLYCVVFLAEKDSSFTLGIQMCLQCNAPCCGYLIKPFFFLQIIRQPGCANLIESRASLQSLHGCKLNPLARVVELTYGHVVV